MQKKRTLLVTLALVLLIIWGNSLLPASASAEISGWLAKILTGFSPDAANGEGLLRKLAHVLEFAALGYVLALIRKRLNKLWSLLFLCGVTVALIDETLQLFSPGRAGMVADIWIDMGGFCLGVLVSGVRQARHVGRRGCANAHTLPVSPETSKEC